MPIVITPTLLAAVGRGYKVIFNKAFEGADSTWGKIAMLVPSETSEEAYPWLASIPGMREWVGDRHINSLKALAFAIKNRKFEDTVSVERDHIEDDQIGLYKPSFEMLAEAAAELPDDLVWSLLPDGFTKPCYDGQFFYDIDHPVIDKNGNTVSVSNNMGGAGVPWYLLSTKRVRKPFIFQKRTDVELTAKDKPEDDNAFFKDQYIYGTRMRCNAGYGFWQCAVASKQTLDEINFNAAYQAAQEIPGDHGKKIKTTPNILVVPPSLRAAATKIVAERMANGADNPNHNIVEVHVEERLAA